MTCRIECTSDIQTPTYMYTLDSVPFVLVDISERNCLGLRQWLQLPGRQHSVQEQFVLLVPSNPVLLVLLF